MKKKKIIISKWWTKREYERFILPLVLLFHSSTATSSSRFQMEWTYIHLCCFILPLQHNFVTWNSRLYALKIEDLFPSFIQKAIGGCVCSRHMIQSMGVYVCSSAIPISLLQLKVPPWCRLFVGVSLQFRCAFIGNYRSIYVCVCVFVWR